MEHGTDVIDRVVARQVKLDGHALPAGVGVNPDAVAGHVAGENRNRVHADLLVVCAVAPLEPGREPPHEGLAHLGGAKRLADRVPKLALLARQVADVFGEEVDFHARAAAVHAARRFGAAGHAPIIARDRHFPHHCRVYVGREDIGEPEVEERILSFRRRVDRRRHMVDDAIELTLIHAFLP